MFLYHSNLPFGICFRKQARDSVVNMPYTSHFLKGSTDWCEIWEKSFPCCSKLYQSWDCHQLKSWEKHVYKRKKYLYKRWNSSFRSISLPHVLFTRKKHFPSLFIFKVFERDTKDTKVTYSHCYNFLLEWSFLVAEFMALWTYTIFPLNGHLRFIRSVVK